ncbi:hypothetical protein SLS54_010628 [Diplodia seriata]
MYSLPKILVLLSVFLFPLVARSCTTDDDCSLNGVCSNSTCLCDPGWRSTDCGELDLRPATKGTGYNHTFANASTSPLSGGTAGNSSWGGQIVRDRHSPTTFHLITSQFSHGCGLSGWKPFSTIIRAESTTGPRGPYFWAQDVKAAFTHNPTVVWSAADALYLLFHIGADDDGYPLPDTCKHQTIAPNNISLSTSPDLRAWTPSTQVLTNATNPAPWPLSSGHEIALAVEDNIIHLAARYDASYAPTVFQPAPGAQPWTEDPFLWRDARGHWHLLVHYMVDVEERGEKGPRVGGHLYARELEGPWVFNNRTLAYNTTVAFDDGTTVDLYRRERPKLFFDEGDEGRVPLFLVNGVQEVGRGKESWTLVQPIGEAAARYERGLGL